MKQWFSYSLATLAIFNMVATPVWAAGTSPSAADRNNAQLAQYREFLEPQGYRLAMETSGKKALVYDNKSDKLVMEIPFAEPTELRKFSPKNLNQMLIDEMARVKSSSKAAWSHSVKNLPAESAIFFTAMGAVVAGQLITNYSQNPIAMKQHIDHSLSPLGVFGFFTFMYSQGVTSNLLSMYIQNPRYHHMIPYLGMTVGAFVQTYLSQIASDPNVMACAKTMLGKKITQKDLESGVDQDPCAKAYEYLVVNKKIWEFAPGIVSMLISSGIAAVLQGAVTKTVLRLTGVDIAMWLAPGSMQLKGMRLLLIKGLQISVFVALDVWLNRKVTYVWKNMYDGADFHESNDRLNEKMNLMKKSQWLASDKDLQAELKDFKKRMTEWRMMNMSEVYEAHQSWTEALQQLTSMFNTSYSFYNTMVNQIRTSRFNESPNKLLERSYLFNGVKAKDLAEGKEDIYLTNPGMAEHMQADTISDVASHVNQILNSDFNKRLLPQERKKISSLVTKLSADSREVMGEGLLDLQTEYVSTLQNITISEAYRSLIRDTYGALGGPRPLKEPGRGFLAAYEKAPSTADTLKGTNFYRQVGHFLTPNITDSLVMQMICGPDLEKGESSVRNSFGYPAVFLPPQIKNSQDQFTFCSPVTPQALSVDHIYSTKIQSFSKEQYTGALDYLVHEARSSVIGEKEKSTFPEWWTTKTEIQMQKAFEAYGRSYDEIVVKLIESVYQSGRSFHNGRPLIRNPIKTVEAFFNDKEFNRQMKGGPIYNGGMNSAFQEERVYLNILEELLQPKKEFQLDFATLLEKEQAPQHALTKEIEKQFAILNGLIQKIKIEKVDGRNVVKSEIENYQLEEQLQNIQAALLKLSKALGVAPESGAEIQVKLNPRQSEVAVTVLEQLQSLASEVMMYGSIANAVSWDKIRNLKRLNLEQQQFNNSTQEKLAKIRGVTLPGRY